VAETVCNSTLVSNFHTDVRISSWASVWLHSWYGYCDYFDCNTLTGPIAMFVLYTVAPLLYRLASSAYFNLSLLSSDFYGLLFGMHFISNFLQTIA
jgi:Solute carrier family 35